MNRRTLLRLGAASAVTLPFVRLLQQPAAAAAVPAQRLLVFFTPNGTVPDRWRPETRGAGHHFPDASPLSALRDHADSLLCLDEMDFNTGSNHEGGMRSMLTAGGDVSIDQVVADHIGGEHRFRSLELSVQTSAWGGSTQTRMSYRDGAFVTPDDDPAHVFQRLFGSTGGPDADARRRSVLDVQQQELADLRRRLGTVARRQLDDHLDGLRDVERSLFSAGLCEGGGAPDAGSPSDNDAFPDLVEAQLQLAVQALACDLTPVVSLQLSHTVSPVVCTWLGESQAHHELSHAGDGAVAGVDSFMNCERWFAAQFGTLLDRLQATEDPVYGGTLFDHTLVLWAKELGDSRLHVCDNVPWVLSGGGGGFRLGRTLRLGGATHDQVLTSIAQAFGVRVNRFGTGTAPALEGL